LSCSLDSTKELNGLNGNPKRLLKGLAFSSPAPEHHGPRITIETSPGTTYRVDGAVVVSYMSCHTWVKGAQLQFRFD
jgi:hypothetical protein